jgi:hypothetical protein
MAGLGARASERATRQNGEAGACCFSSKWIARLCGRLCPGEISGATRFRPQIEVSDSSARAVTGPGWVRRSMRSKQTEPPLVDNTCHARYLAERGEEIPMAVNKKTFTAACAFVVSMNRAAACHDADVWKAPGGDASQSSLGADARWQPVSVATPMRDEAGARGVHTPPPRRFYFLSLRPTLGMGVGSRGIGILAGAAGEFWLNRFVGTGLEGGALAEGLFGGASANYALLDLALRTFDDRNSDPSGFLATVGGGYARVRQLSNPSAPERFDGYCVALGLGWLAHPGRSDFELGPVFRGKLFGDLNGASVNGLVTLNLELGFGLTRQYRE